MSRIGKKPITVPDGVTASVDGQRVTAKGPLGEMTYVVNDAVLVSQADGEIKVDPRDESPDSRSKWGLSRTMVANVVNGVKSGFEEKLEINGVGYRAALQGKDLQLSLGYSHEVLYPVPEGIEGKVPKPTEVVISGMNKQQVGQVAANIREFRPPEPYKGKGVKYASETITRKEGKKK